ncbi:MAG TPA: DUF4397 domain-containing protein, partial [Chitinophagaceae bacterium]|nr:DUF4397 domain-containing protein [Chitinophagaceae bacterium]
MKCLHLGISCLTIAATSFLYISCKRETPQVAAIDTNFSNSATVQVFNATVKSARNYIFVDGSPVSGSGLAFGAVFPASAYAIRLPAGSRSFLIRDTSSTSTQPPLNFTQTLDVGKSYTIFMYDTLTSPKQSAVVNNITIPTDTTSRLRFANFVYSSTSIPNVDVYSFRRGTAAPVFANVANGTVTDF